MQLTVLLSLKNRNYNVTFDGKNLESGILHLINAGNQSVKLTLKMIAISLFTCYYLYLFQ